MKKVRCIDDYGARAYITVGQIYEVAEELNDISGLPAYILVGIDVMLWQKRFEVVEEETSSTISAKPVSTPTPTPTSPPFDFEAYNRGHMIRRGDKS
jgi:hypothetical protein